MKDGVDVSVQPDKSLTEMEKELLGKFQVCICADKQWKTKLKVAHRPIFLC